MRFLRLQIDEGSQDDGLVICTITIASRFLRQHEGLKISPAPGAMASALSALATDENVRIQLGGAGKKRASELFSLERMLRDHTEIYHLAHR